MKKTLVNEMQFRVPSRFDPRTTFATLPPLLTSEGKKALAYCKAWAAAPDKKPGPLLMGQSGTFKTHLLWATARALSERAHAEVLAFAEKRRAAAELMIDEGSLQFSHEFNIHFPHWPVWNLVTTDGAEIAHEVRSSVERKNLDEVVARYRQEKWEPARATLLVDDVEVMKLSDWLHEELYRIFDYRYQELMPTLVATNLSGEELRRHLGDRIARRILDMTEPFTL